MPAKYSAALVVIALFAWRAAGSRLKDVVPSSYASNATHVPSSSKRYLRPNVKMKASSNTDEERVQRGSWGRLLPTIITRLQAIYGHEFDGLFVNKPAEESLYSGFYSIVPSDPIHYKKVLKAMLPSLTKRFKDELFPVLVARAKMESDKRRIAKDLLDIQASMWNKDEKTAKMAFKVLQLDKTDGNLFEDPLFLTWTILFKSPPTLAYTKMFATLQSLFVDDDKLASVLVAGTKVKSDAGYVAEKLRKVQAKEWKKGEAEATGIFLLLHLDKTTRTELFENPQVLEWFNQVYLKFPYTWRRSIFATMQRFCEGDDLTKVLLAGTRIESTKLFAIQLLKYQAKELTESTKIPEEHFRSLGLDRAQGNPIVSPLFSEWFMFVESRYPKAAYTIMYAILQKYMGDKLNSGLLAGLVGEESRLRVVKLASISPDKDMLLQSLLRSVGLV